MTEIQYCAECNQPVVAGVEACNHCGAEVGPDLERASIWHKLQGRLSKATEGKYEVDRLVGYGGMAGVYLARDIHLNRNVALKLILPAVVMDPKMVRRFRQEAQTMAQLNHRHIVPVYDIKENDELLFIVMQYVPGRTLSEVATDATTALAPDLVATWMIQISEALAHAHGRPTPVIHRDIKPSNILLDEKGDAQLADFGIAKVQDNSNLTRTGHLIGTPAYMSPEQCRGDTLTAASDQYSLGTVAYELLTGAPPFLGPTLSVLLAHSADEPADLTISRPGCPSELASAIQRMLAKKPEDRWAGMEAAAEALRDAIGSMVAPKQLKVWAKQSLNIDLNANPSPLDVGTSEQLYTRVLDNEGEELVGRRVHWSSTNASVASVTREGLVGGEGPGSAVLVGRSGKAVTTVEMEIVTSGKGEVPQDPAIDAADSATKVVDPKIAVVDVPIETLDEGEPALTESPVADTENSDKTIVIPIPTTPARDGTQILRGLDWSLPSGLVAPGDHARHDDEERSDRPKDDESASDADRSEHVALAQPPGPSSGPMHHRGEAMQADRTRVGVAPVPLDSPGRTPAVDVLDGDGHKAAPPFLRWTGIAVGILAAGLVGTALKKGFSDNGQMEEVLASVLPLDTVLTVGEQFRFRVELEANTLEELSLSWSSSDLSVASVSPTGLLEARGPGMVTISLIGEGLQPEPLIVTVVPESSPDDDYRRLELDSLPVDLVVGATFTIRPWFVDQDEQRVPAGGLVWTTTDSAVLAVTGLGNFEARGSGTVVVEASSSDFGLTKKTSVTVTASPSSSPRSPRPVPSARVPTDLRITPSTGEIEIGESRSVNARVRDQDGREITEASITWRSSDRDIVMVSAQGEATGMARGSAWVTAVSGSLRDSTRIVVSTPQPAVPTAQPAATALSAEDATEILDRFLSTLRSAGEERILSLVPEGEREEHERYISLASQGRLEAAGNIQEVQIDGTTVTFSLPVSARTSFGGSRDGTMQFIAELHAIDGVWELRRLVPASGSTPP